jgi:hypothetical protein
VQQDLEDLITGVRAFYDRRDHSEFVRTWNGHLLVLSGADDQTPTPATATSDLGTGRGT